MREKHLNRVIASLGLIVLAACAYIGPQRVLGIEAPTASSPTPDAGITIRTGPPLEVRTTRADFPLNEAYNLLIARGLFADPTGACWSTFLAENTAYVHPDSSDPNEYDIALKGQLLETNIAACDLPK